MRFMIHGADQKTGREMTLVLEAPDESEAERRALYNDILVSSVARFTAEMAAPVPPRRVEPVSVPRLNYRPAEIPAGNRGAKPPNPAGVAPRYRDILRGARWLDAAGTLARWGGGVVMLAAVALILIVLIDPLRQRLGFPVQPVLWMAVAGVLMVAGMLCLCCGVMVSMMSGLATAVRDIAQNTFHVAARSTPDADADEPLGKRSCLPQIDVVVTSHHEVTRVGSADSGNSILPTR